MTDHAPSRRRVPRPGGRDDEMPFRALADAVPVLLWMADVSGGCTYLNRRWLEFTGRDMESELGEGWMEGMHPDDVERFLTVYRRALASEARFEAEFRLRTASGSYRWVLDRGVPLRGGEGRFAGYIGACFDITDRRRATEELRESRALLDTIIESAPLGFALLDDDMRFLRVNETFAEITGRPAAEHLDSRLPDVLPGIPPQRYTAPFRRAVGSGESVTDHEISGVTPATSGAEHHWLTSWYPVRSPVAEERLGVGLFATDITQRVRAERGIQLLSDVGEALDATLGVDERLERLAGLLVPELADFCTIDVLDSSGTPRLVALAHATPAGARLLRLLREQADPAAPLGIADAIRTGVPDVVPEIAAEALDEYAAESPAGDTLRRLAPCSYIVMPLRARGRVLGALSLAMSSSGRTYDGDDVALARQLGRRVGMAVDNARLYEEQRHIAHTLQRSLLPPLLPEITGLELAARFCPMGSGTEVGGDFYDVFAAGASWAAVIGDVCGKGADAAALTSLARHSIRALSRYDPPPSGVLTDLNEVILRERGPETRFSTVLYARLAPQDGGLAVTLASAGHPLPYLLRASGEVETVGRPGTLLGPFPTVRVRDAACDLAPGDALVLYTDGVTEARRDGPELYGEDRLAALLRTLAGSDADEIAGAIEADVMRFQGSDLLDDLAVLVVRVDPTGAGGSTVDRC